MTNLAFLPSSLALGKAVGRDAAHEIGHFLLQTTDHSDGVMSQGFKGAQWFHRSFRGEFKFDKNQQTLLRSKLPDKGGTGNSEIVRRINV
jgi:hypothetical protein